MYVYRYMVQGTLVHVHVGCVVLWDSIHVLYSEDWNKYNTIT